MDNPTDWGHFLQKVKSLQFPTTGFVLSESNIMATYVVSGTSFHYTSQIAAIHRRGGEGVDA